MEKGSPTSEMLMAMSSEELKAHVEKMNALQRKLTSEEHIRRVDSFIPAAVRFAKKKAGGNSTLRSKFFVQEMSRLTCEAGLRCC